MAKRPRRDGHKAVDRFASLRARRETQPARYDALERRERLDAAHLAAARKRFAASDRQSRAAALEQRRTQYAEIARQPQVAVLPRHPMAFVAASFVLPLLVALLANLARPPAAAPPQAGRHPAHQLHLAMRPGQPRRHAVTSRVASQAPRIRPTMGQTEHATNAAPAATTVARVMNQPVPQASVAAQLAGSFATVPAVRETAVARALSPQVVAFAPKRPQRIRPHAPSSPWTLTPDGTWTAVVRAPAGAQDASFTVSTGQIIALERSAIDADAATVTIGWSRSVDVGITSSGGSRTQSLPAPDDSPATFAATAGAVGPHLVDVGWTPLGASAAVAGYEIYRTSGDDADPQLVARVAASKHSWRDSDIGADSRYRYDVVALTSSASVEANTQQIDTPDELPGATASSVAGKGMFLYFSSLPEDQRYYGRYRPEAAIAEAHKAGIRVIELRMARGTCVMAQTPQARAWVDRLVDAAAQNGISLIAWTVPRRVTTQDVAQTIAAAEYKTPAGNGFVGLALDLETGDRYMGDGPKARASLAQYIQMVRAATGPHYLIVATVASPGIGDHTNADYPYARIAAYADVMQPMEYWHYFDASSHHEYRRREVAGAAAAAVARTRELAGRDIPVDVAGQSVDLEGTGAPSGSEISWSLRGAKSAGGIGETFFDWAGTRPDAWAAIQAFDW